ncbi:hypothetical protein Mahau_0575 [Mahella australiensis 50-1 BON]|uniref:Uncharacterized protein n=1 Tax=Mahella australiensis (strain DSM 15567 / CIP 107919 / 50-1 BON) TaxID=697281 RepID=F3ZZG8_MAHA5|nr:hypothetical protein Mahau_0575 [Mahella australiensis 50-1 BON]
MSKCENCAWYPWVPGADLSMLPVMRCSPRLAARRWTTETIAMENNCPEFKAVIESDVNTGTDNEVKKAPKRANTTRRK